MTTHPIHNLFVLHEDSVLRGLLQAASLPGWKPIPVDRWGELRVRLRHSAPGAVAVVDPYAGPSRPGELSHELRACVAEFSSAIVIAAARFPVGSAGDLCTLGHWGVNESVIDLATISTPEALEKCLASIELRGLPGLVERHLVPRVKSGRGQQILRAASQAVVRGGNVEAISRSLHTSPRTLERWCEASGLLPPRRLLCWMRAAVAAELLRDTGRSVEDVAFACGYSSKSALHRVVRGLVGMSPGRLRTDAVSDVVIEGLAEEMFGGGAVGSARAPGLRARS